MEEEKDPSKEYIKGFNAGYVMAENEPELLKRVLAGNNDNGDYTKALKAGQKQYEIELIHKQTQNKTRRNERER